MKTLVSFLLQGDLSSFGYFGWSATRTGCSDCVSSSGRLGRGVDIRGTMSSLLWLSWVCQRNAAPASPAALHELLDLPSKCTWKPPCSLLPAPKTSGKGSNEKLAKPQHQIGATYFLHSSQKKCTYISIFILPETGKTEFASSSCLLLLLCRNCWITVLTILSYNYILGVCLPTK